MNASYLANPSDAINTIYKSYDSNLVATALNTNETRTVEFYFDADFNLLEEKTSKSYNFVTNYSLRDVEGKTDIKSYSFSVVSYEVNGKTIRDKVVDFGEIYVKNL